MNRFAYVLLMLAGVCFGEDEVPPLMKDLNFDGHPDKMVERQRGGGGNAVNIEYDVSLFDPKTKQYIPNEQLSEMGSPEPDPKAKTITTFWRCRPQDRTSVYRWQGSKLVLIEETVIEQEKGGTRVTVKKRRDGKMVVVSSTLEEVQ